jgi:hypothetical protein
MHVNYFYCKTKLIIVKGESHEIFWVLFLHLWIDLGLCKNL